ncbi:MAG: SMI1/KNR4 family protein [Pirellulaceae bacterium]|nr:SMI1/KNR4 family protein [Pirellulaceae bacterium]
MFDWDSLLVRLRTYPSHFHRLLPPTSGERIEEVERELGKLPQTLAEMLMRFNGAELFIAGSPLVSFFRISTSPPLPPLEWAPEWCIDKFTPQWRTAGPNRKGDWAIAMTNYGGLVLLDADGIVKEWDIGESKWVSGKQSLEHWIENVMSEGEAIMAE